MIHISIREIPKNERPFEKAVSKGVDTLEDSELISILIRSGTAELSAIEISRSILNHPLVNNKLNSLCALSRNDLEHINGLGKVKSIQILALIELSKRIARSKASPELSFKTPESIADYYMEDLRHLKFEIVKIVFLNSKGAFLGDKDLFKGTATASLASPREVFIEAVKHNAIGIIFIHNHPSGDSAPSKDDIILTQRLVSSGKMLQIPLIDHIIIGDKNYYSFREKGKI